MTTAYLDYSLDVECPSCEAIIDLTSEHHDGEYYLATKIFTNKWDEVKGFEITCEHCGYQFKLDGVEY